jgi:DNA primase
MPERPNHAGEVRAALTDPVSLCDGLSLISGRKSYQRQARGVTILCPWHDERTPSCSVFLKNGSIAVRCHGCGASGDALHLVAAAHRLDVRADFRRVLEIGADLAGIRLDDGHTPSLRPAPRPAPPEPERLDHDTFDRIAEVLAAECPLASQPDVCRYLADRGLLEEAGTSLYALPGDRKGQLRARDAIVATVGQDAWMRSGLARKDGSWAWYEHRLCIPWCEKGVAGVVTTLQRRLIRDARPDEPGGKYVFPTGRAHPSQPYGAEEVENLAPASAICFVEGALDTLAMRALCRREGIDRWVLGLPGTGGWRAPWAKLAESRLALIGLDPDKAGERQVQCIAADLRNAGAIAVKRVRPARDDQDWADEAAGA